MAKVNCILFIILLLLGCLKGIGNERLAIDIEWTCIGPDGGDMHFVYITEKHILFASHGFGGIWRSVDRGESWEYISNEEWIDTNFMAMDEINGSLIAGGNNGLWISNDDGKTWERIITGDDAIDLYPAKYEIVSIVALSKNHILFSARVNKGTDAPAKHGFFELKNDNLIFHELPERASKNAVIMLAYENILFVSSSEKGLYTYDFKEKWNKILDKKTTRVFVRNGTVYVGTIGDWYYIGKYDKGWKWEHIIIPAKKCGVATFIIPDAYNEKWLWLGASREGHIFSTEEEGTSFVACGYWDGGWKEIYFKYNYSTMIAIDKHRENERMEDYVIDTPYGEKARYAYVSQGGAACIQKTEDGGKTWENAYNGIYADTINKISYLEGIREGDIIVTCVSGNQITGDYGETWEEGIDFTLGDVGYGLPGYAWGAASPSIKFEGKYDLLIATGYPPENFVGNGVYAIDTEALKQGKDYAKRIFSYPSFEILIDGNDAFIGRMDSGVSKINLNNYKEEKLQGIPDDEAGLNLFYYGGKLYISTIKGGNKNNDNYFFTDKNAVGGLYVYDGKDCKQIYHGKRIVGFAVGKKGIYAITNDCRLLYFRNNEKKWEVLLPSATYSDIAIDWNKKLIFLSTFDKGLFYTNFYLARFGKLQALEGLPTKRIRCLLLSNGFLFAGTQGHSVWRGKIEMKVEERNFFLTFFQFS